MSRQFFSFSRPISGNVLQMMRGFYFSFSLLLYVFPANFASRLRALLAAKRDHRLGWQRQKGIPCQHFHDHKHLCSFSDVLGETIVSLCHCFRQWMTWTPNFSSQSAALHFKCRRQKFVLLQLPPENVLSRQRVSLDKFPEQTLTHPPARAHPTSLPILPIKMHSVQCRVLHPYPSTLFPLT